MKNIDQGAPMLSEISIESSVHEEIEVLKHLVYLKIIESNRMKAVAYRATYILNTIFDALIDHGSGTLIKGHELLPDDFLIKFQQAGISRKSHKKDRDDDHVKQNRARVVADFIAGMTDRYAVEFYGRLTSENFQTIFRHY
jgi:dGTPase